MLEILGGITLFAMNTMMMFIFIIIEIVFILMIGGMAKARGRNTLGWMLIGAFAPFVALITLLILTRKYPKTDKDFDHISELRDYNPLVVAVVGIFGYVSNADGRVDENEYESVYLHLKKSYNMSKRDLKGYREIIEYTKNNPDMVDTYTGLINKYTKDKNRTYDNIRFLAMLCNVVALNGVETEEIDAVKRVMAGLRFPMDDMGPLTSEMEKQGASQSDIDDLVDKL
ncbi:TerB family tellurite resistance protein [Acidaminobacter sp. JC074]|uniref:tellurite resistance TerB family protein n=1 Tax=Acidaminobacter sp. JC074 TaxID=2530199 RepID=UPI001F0DE79A|nr:TerB family tellurite resistance protein [Acidaminobacter sp. JC074]MCH4887081.1 TerB family tellurite resistance protein [Acidaminobacter sp. JC074]